MTRCEHCNNGDRQPASRAQVAERGGQTAVVLGVPVEECPACGLARLPMDVARRLDLIFAGMLRSDVEVAIRHYGAA